MQPAHRKPLLIAFSKLLVDSELEVSSRAVESIRELGGSLELDEAPLLFVNLRQVLVSENVDMRRSLARSAPYLAPFCPPNSQNYEFLKEVLASILKDENAEVKANLMLHCEALGKSFSHQQLASYFSAQLLDLLGDKSWKVRKEAVAAFEILALRLGESFPAEERIQKTIKERLADRVFEVRVRMIEAIKNLSAVFGRDWTEKTALGILSRFATNPNFLYRLSYVFGIKEICGGVGNAVALKEADILFKMARDPVPNVRVQAILTLVKIVRQVEEKSLEDRLMSLLKDLEGDSDTDVQRIVGRGTSSSLKQVLNRLVDLKLI